MSMTSGFNSAEASVKFCRRCGEKLLGDSLFCHKCGTKIVVAQPAAATSGQKQRPRWVNVLLLVLVIAAVIFFTRDRLKLLIFCDVHIMGDQEISMVAGDAYVLSYQADLKGISESEIEWASLDPSVAEVSDEGIITATGEGRTSVIVLLSGEIKDSCDVIVSLKPMAVENGQMILAPRDTGYPEITIHTSDENACFAYFKNTSDPANDFAFYVAAGSSATVNAPAGTYMLYYATGETWYGEKLKFGMDSAFYKSPDPIILTEDSEGYDILELTLYAVPDGNMEREFIDESEFPI